MARYDEIIFLVLLVLLDMGVDASSLLEEMVDLFALYWSSGLYFRGSSGTRPK